MSLLLGCPDFDYGGHAQARTLTDRIQEVLLDLHSGQIDTLAAASDSRPIHGRFFAALTPPGFEYYAGHYRGEDYPCLRDVRVTIPNDQRVGAAAHSVAYLLREFAQRLASGCLALDFMHAQADADVPARTKLLGTVALACALFEAFLSIHPYLDGNGHAARFILWAVLARYRYWPGRWRLDPRPDPPYVEVIRKYRDGQKGPLEAYVLRMIADWP